LSIFLSTSLPIPDKSAATTARIFTEYVLCRFGSCAEVVTDVGTEFAEEFAELLRQYYIDHRTTSPNQGSTNRTGTVNFKRASWTLFFYAHKLTATRRALETSQKGLPEAQIGYGYGMLPGYGPPDINLSSLVLDGSPA